MRKTRTELAFVGVVIIACLSTFLYGRSQTHQLARANADACDNYIVLRDAVNDFHGTIRQLLITAKKAREVSAKTKSLPKKIRNADKTAVKGYNKLLKHIKTVNATCAQKIPENKKEKKHGGTTTTTTTTK